jgi:ectoine hydroxylase-related dioxygenase (phytanoyl-CoA dioxygenase family)
VDAEEVDEFRERGVLKVDYVDLVGSDVFDGLMRALDDAEQRAAGGPSADDGYGGNVFFRVGSLFAQYPEVEAAVRAPRVGELAARLAGVERMRRWSDETFFKPPGSDPCAWHQDFPHYPMDRRGLLTVWVAIDDVTAEMGPILYFAGSHHLGPRAQSTVPAGRRSAATGSGGLGGPDRFLREGEVLDPPISFALKAGEAVVHDGCMIHGGEGNRSDRMRRGWACIYFPSEARYTEAPVRPEAAGLGLVPSEPFAHPKFPVIDY